MFAVLSIFIESVLLNKNTYINILNQNGTYGQVKDTIYNKIDQVLSAKNINIDIKESIITEDDIKRESDNIITGFVDYLRTGQNNIPAIDTEVYKQRVSDVLESFVKDPTNISSILSNDLSFNGDFNMSNMVSVKQDINFNNMVATKNNSFIQNNGFVVEQLASREEIEAEGRAILKSKGMTEAQARQKLAEKGLTEDQVWKMLADDGYLDGDTSSSQNSNQADSSNNSNSNDDVQDNSSTSEKSNSNTSPTKEGNSKTESSNKSSDNSSTKNPLQIISDKLLNNAGTIIDNEIQKINLSGLMESNKIQKIAKITSTFHKMFMLFMVMPFLLILILIGINGRKLSFGLKYIANGFLVAGLIMFVVFFGAYILRFYENINVNLSYFKDTISNIIKYFLIVLWKAGIGTFVIGLILSIPTIKNILVSKIRNQRF